MFSRIDVDGLVDVEWCNGRDDLAHALEAPVWDRYGTFSGQPLIQGTITWLVSVRSVLIAGHQGGRRFEETIA
jgi:hypothetical protein